MAENVWSAPTHPDPPEDRPIGVEPDPAASPVDMAPVTVNVEFTRTGPQTLPGFVERASHEKVYVQLVHMGFPQRVWLERSRATTRRLKPRRT